MAQAVSRRDPGQGNQQGHADIKGPGKIKGAPAGPGGFAAPPAFKSEKQQEQKGGNFTASDGKRQRKNIKNNGMAIFR